MLFKNNPMVENLNVIFRGKKIEDVGEKIGRIFGEKGREIGRKIDEATKNITINLDDIIKK